MLKEDWEHIEPILSNAIHRIPKLENIGVRMLLNGPESFTPDDHFLLGEPPELKGFFIGCGMCSVGIASGGGAGRALAEWILNGEPTMDLWSVDIRRFSPIHNTNRIPILTITSCIFSTTFKITDMLSPSFKEIISHTNIRFII